jgi:ferrous iron transport protein A
MPPLTLDQLQPGQTAVITLLTSQGINRRRLMDLGLLPGTLLQAELRSPLGDPVAYRIRGALIALRRSQAREIQIELDGTAL